MNVTTEQASLQTAGSAMLQGIEATGTRDGIALRVAYMVTPSARAKLNRAVGSGIKAAIVRVSKAARTSHDAEAIAASQARSGVVAEALRAAQAELRGAEEASKAALNSGQLDEASLAPLDRATALRGRISALQGEASRLAHETRQAETQARSFIGRAIVEEIAQVERDLVGEITGLEQRILAAVASDLERLLAAHAMLDNLRSSGRRMIEAEAVSAVLPRVVNM